MTAPGAARMAEVERTLGVSLPEPVRALYRVSDGWYSAAGEWFVIWPLRRLVEGNQDAWELGLPRNLLAFGDDGTGDPFCVDLDDSTDVVVRWNWIDLEVEPQGSVAAFRDEWLR
ncbi:SMI1/KNR4 family protein [Actinotalea sp. C106]|uniref:SMI1/KNR4 family protein n=1 Tax=Actinotalea sp. C106 TaxID=2908644 RepID=UPI0020283A28|nr:SMI1/KNR4 family protein [Actinotalea sp. C106]